MPGTEPRRHGASEPMRSLLAELFLGSVCFAGGVLSALLGQGVVEAGFDVGYLVLFEPVLAAAVLARRRAAMRGGVLAFMDRWFRLDRDRFRLAGWAASVALSFTLSAFVAADNPHDAAAVWLFAGILFMFVSGVPIAAVDHGLSLRESWASLHRWVGASGRRERRDSTPGRFESAMRAHWDDGRRREDERRAGNPLLTVEGWEALKRAQDEDAAQDRPA